MEIRTYRARSMQEALQMVRADLGPQAAVLHTQQIGGWLGWLRGRRIEVTASTSFDVPSRFHSTPSRGRPQQPGPDHADATRPPVAHPAPPRQAIPTADMLDLRAGLRRGLKQPAHFPEQGEPPSVDPNTAREPRLSNLSAELPQSLFQLYTELIDAELSEDLARDLVDQLNRDPATPFPSDMESLRRRVAECVEQQLAVTGPIEVAPGQRRVVALVGPTGVGKTTTIAKLAANFHLRDQRRVGLITVDTYRIAAVEQLRTYADIIDLPMEVVSTPREMRQAVERLEDLELILVDTAGRSPRDELRLQELKTMLTEARADEVHLVLSCVASAQSLAKTSEQFARVGTTSLLLTKLDEATGLGHLLPVVRRCGLPVSYLTNGQNVPDDIAAAQTRRLARQMLGLPNTLLVG